MWLTFFSALTVATACASLAISVFAALRAARALESPPLRLRSVELRLQSVEQLAEEHTAAMTELANRLKMIKVRSATSHGSKTSDGLPDPYTDADAWRKAMTAKIGMAKLNGG